MVEREREVTIHDTVVEYVAKIAFYVEGKGLVQTAKKFVDEAFTFFETLGDKRITHRPYGYLPWRQLSYRCATFKSKYTVAYLETTSGITICDISLTSLLVNKLQDQKNKLLHLQPERQRFMTRRPTKHKRKSPTALPPLHPINKSSSNFLPLRYVLQPSVHNLCRTR